MEKNSKKMEKGQAAQSVGAIITLITGVGVAVLILILVGSLGGSTFNLLEDDLNSIANNVVKGEPFNSSIGVPYDLAHSFIQENTVIAYHANGTKFHLGNLTIDYEAGTVLLKASGVDHNNTLNTINYTWGAKEVREGVKNSILSSFNALENTGSYLPVIVLAIVISLVLMLILGMGMIGNVNSGGGSAL